MNEQSKQMLTFTLTVAIEEDQLQPLLTRLSICVPSVENASLQSNLKSGPNAPRLAFTMRETAEILGVCHQTVYRLLKRGLLRSSLALRTKIIPKAEIERFLKETSRSLY